MRWVKAVKKKNNKNKKINIDTEISIIGNFLVCTTIFIASYTKNYDNFRTTLIFSFDISLQNLTEM
jgi:hypothetical protein